VISLSAKVAQVSAITLRPLVWSRCAARAREQTYLFLLESAVKVQFYLEGAINVSSISTKTYTENFFLIATRQEGKTK
jgi:hypothetical protein